MRYQAQHQSWVTNCRHEPVTLDLISLRILSCLDGKRDVEGILDVLVKQIKKGDLNIQFDGKAVSDEEKIRDMLRTSISTVLPRLAQVGLLVE